MLSELSPPMFIQICRQLRAIDFHNHLKQERHTDRNVLLLIYICSKNTYKQFFFIILDLLIDYFYNKRIISKIIHSKNIHN